MKCARTLYRVLRACHVRKGWGGGLRERERETHTHTWSACSKGGGSERTGRR